MRRPPAWMWVTGAVIVVAAAVGVYALAQESDNPYDLSRPLADSLSQDMADAKERWSPPTRADARRTLSFLESDEGRLVVEFTRRVPALENEIDAAAVEDRCRSLMAALDERFPEDRLFQAIDELADEGVRDSFIQQLSAVRGAFDSCADGDGARGRTAARLARAWNDVYVQRLAELEATR